MALCSYPTCMLGSTEFAKNYGAHSELPGFIVPFYYEMF